VETHYRALACSAPFVRFSTPTLGRLKKGHAATNVRP